MGEGHYTGVETEPRYAASDRGEIGYRGNSYGTGVNVGYKIEGAGDDHEIILTILKEPE